MTTDLTEFNIDNIRNGSSLKEYHKWLKDKRKEDRRLANNEYNRRMSFIKRKNKVRKVMTPEEKIERTVIYRKDYYIKNKERILTKNKEYYIKNKESISIKMKDYYIKNK